MAFHCRVCDKETEGIADSRINQVICPGCGAVLKGGYYEEDEERRQRSWEISILSNKAQTTIGKPNIDTSPNRLPKITTKLRFWDKRAQAQSRAESNSFDKAERLLEFANEKLGLNDSICERIAYLFKKAYDYGFPRRRQRQGLHFKATKHFYIIECLCACIYIACTELRKRHTKYTKRRYGFRSKRKAIPIISQAIHRELNGVPIGIRENNKNIIRSHKQIKECAKLMNEVFDLKIKKFPSLPIDNNISETTKVDQIELLMIDISDKLKLSRECYDKAWNMFKRTLLDVH